jgi:hypothetical protein
MKCPHCGKEVKLQMRLIGFGTGFAGESETVDGMGEKELFARAALIEELNQEAKKAKRKAAKK